MGWNSGMEWNKIEYIGMKYNEIKNNLNGIDANRVE
jgi:hypothetical protein